MGETTTLALLLAVLLVPGLVAALLWSPFLLSDRLCALFRALPPRDGLVASYLPVAVGGALPYVVGGLWALSRGPPGGDAVAVNALLDVVVGVSVAYVVAGPLVAGVALPRFGRDWDPTGYGPGTWALLGTGSAWFAVLYGVPLFLMAAVLAYPA
ncbi:hypothetical protein BRC89_07025 [Halobacteriales archaeon QS_4_70_19]|nr:MAG: hypothetical protein BRC89_07025 [Halobacteriales archaeon QS_4_70_19]